MSKVAYQPHFVAYIDILGFKDNILKDPEAVDIASFRDRLQEAMKTSGIDKPNMPRVKMFSDSLTMTALSREYPLALFLFGIGCYQVEMVRLGFFLRGAVVCGKHYEDDRLLFGPALIQAVEFEKTLALWPRIVVHPQLAMRDPCYPYDVPKWPPERTLQQDSDGLSYIDYLSMVVDESPTAFIKQHKEQVMQQIEITRNKRDYRALAKYR